METIRVKKHPQEITGFHRDLGPILYLIYANEIINTLQNSLVYAYADDTAILVIDKNIENAYRTMQHELNTVTKWSHDNGLVINASKTKLMHIKPPHLATYNINLKFHDYQCLHNSNILSNTDTCSSIIEIVKTYKYLGVYVDENFKWLTQIQELRKKLRKSAYSLFHLSNCANFNVLKQAYFALSESYIRHGITAWGNSTYCKSLQQTQNQILKILLKKQLKCNEQLQYVMIYNQTNTTANRNDTHNTAHNNINVNISLFRNSQTNTNTNYNNNTNSNSSQNTSHYIYNRIQNNNITNNIHNNQNTNLALINTIHYNNTSINDNSYSLNNNISQNNNIPQQNNITFSSLNSNIAMYNNNTVNNNPLENNTSVRYNINSYYNNTQQNNITFTNNNTHNNITTDNNLQESNNATANNISTTCNIATKLQVANVKTIYNMCLINEFYDDPNYLIPIDHAYNTRNRSEGRYKVERFHNNYGKRCLNVTLPNILNSIPINLLNISNPYKRKKIFKDYFIKTQ